MKTMLLSMACLIGSFTVLHAGERDSVVNIPAEKIAAAVAAIPEGEFAGVPSKKITELENRYFAVDLHNEVNHFPYALFLNGTFVKSWVGIDTSSFTIPQKRVNQTEVLYEGQLYEGKIDLRSDSYKPELVGLEDIHKQYAPDVPVRNCLFMVDGILLTDDLAQLRLDKAYIKQVDVLRPGDIQNYNFREEDMNLCVLQIQTKKYLARQQGGNTHSEGKDGSASGGKSGMLRLKDIVESTPFAPYSRPVFIINDRVVTSDFDKIAIDRDAIYSILQFGPADIESLAKGVVQSGWQHTGPVSVIRIYVKDVATRQKARDAVRII